MHLYGHQKSGYLFMLVKDSSMRYLKIICFIIIFLLTSNGLYLRILGHDITSGRILAVAGGFYIGFISLYRMRIKAGGNAGLILALWLALSLAIDIVYSQHGQLIKNWASLALSVSMFYVIINLHIDWKIVQDSIIRVGFLLGALSITVLLAKLTSFNPHGLISYLAPRSGDLHRLVLLSKEPNILGAFMAITAIMTLPVLAFNRRRGLIYILVMLIGLVGALSKGPWLAFAVGAFSYGIILRKINKKYTGIFKNKYVLVIATTLLIIALGLLLLFQPAVLRERDSLVRLIELKYAFLNISNNLFFGTGTFSFSLLWPHLGFLFGAHNSKAIWISQTVVAVLHDTGIFGLILFVLFLFLLYYRALMALIKASRSGINDDALLFSASVIAVAFALLVQDEVTTLYSLPVYWSIMGLLFKVPGWLRGVK